VEDHLLAHPALEEAVALGAVLVVLEGVVSEAEVPEEVGNTTYFGPNNKSIFMT
jgi:hypothetical protein